MHLPSKELETTVVTGGAGFIGSHLVDKLISNGVNVKVIDNLSNGKLSNLSKCQDKENFCIMKKDLKNLNDKYSIFNDVKTVFHLAANPEVRNGFEHPEISFNENIRCTYNLLENIRKSDVQNIIFTSTSTVYGEPDIVPTSEDYGPLLPISQYGSSKLSCEAMISSYCYTYGIKGIIFRLANVVGKRSTHGVTFDFITKLRRDNKKLEVLGDGTQSKSYIHVSDCIDCFLFCQTKQEKQVEIFNLGNEDRVDVMFIAKNTCKCMGFTNVDIITTGGVDNGRGWIGDVKIMQLDISKLKELGWHPRFSSAAAMELACKELAEELTVSLIGN